MAKIIHLIGTCHIDIDGEQKLNTLLTKLSPNVITLEHNSKLIITKKECQEMSNNIISSLNPSNEIESQFIHDAIKSFGQVLGYEYKTCQKYVCDNNILLLSIEKDHDYLLFQNMKSSVCSTHVDIASFLLRPYMNKNVTFTDTIKRDIIH